MSDFVCVCVDWLDETSSRPQLAVLLQKNNAHPLRAMLPLVTQMPIFVSFFLALRNCAGVPVHQTPISSTHR